MCMCVYFLFLLEIPYVSVQTLKPGVHQFTIIFFCLNHDIKDLCSGDESLKSR